MAKQKTIYICSACEATSHTWLGKCPACNEWDSLKSRIQNNGGSTKNAAATFAAHIDQHGCEEDAVQLLQIEAPSIGRCTTGIDELDRVLGGGLVVGSVVLIGGDPGIGKSTLMMQTAIGISTGGNKVLYATSEESGYQCKLRAKRLLTSTDCSNADLQGLFVLADTDLARITKQVMQLQPQVLVIDSIQMVYRSDLESTPGSVSQIRRCCLELVYLARKMQMSVLVVGHVTKDGQLAGPRLLEHLVDVVLNFEGDPHYALRGLRGVKNRFGTTLEVGLFEMGPTGLEEVKDAAAFLDPEAPPRAGAIVAPAMHGARCLLVEVQALVAAGVFGQARRRATGLEGSRLTMLCAVLEQHAGLQLIDQDIYASTVGGLKLSEPAIDLALCLSIAGGYAKRIIQSKMCAIGEVGLGGEVRSVPHLPQRAAQVRRRGYKHILVPITQVDVAGEGAIGVGSIADLGDYYEKS